MTFQVIAYFFDLSFYSLEFFPLVLSLVVPANKIPCLRLRARVERMYEYSVARKADTASFSWRLRLLLVG